MNRTNKSSLRFVATAALATLILGACATAVKDPGAGRARAALSTLQGDADLASRAPVAIKDAETAVRAAEAEQEDEATAKQLGYVAEQKVAIARSQAERRFEEDRLKTLGEERERVRLQARTTEADAAKLQAQAALEQAQTALGQAQAQQRLAQQATSEADRARAESEALKQQIAELNARPTDRGLVMTLGDVLFATGRAELQPGALNNLGKLVQFLNQYPERTLAIEGHTDNVGSDDLNLGLSQRRADSVQAFLVGQGVDSQRVSASGKGEGFPVASNDNVGGRQQNRRVEIVISNPAK